MVFIDLTGKKFGRLLVIEKFNYEDKLKQYRWLCLCDCGTYKNILGEDLREGKTKSCGCLARETARHIMLNRPRNNSSSFENVVGKKFNKLKVLSCVEKNKHGKYLWNCICDCGNIVSVLGSSLVTQKTKSCGCYRSELFKSNAYKERMSKTILRGEKHPFYGKTHSEETRKKISETLRTTETCKGVNNPNYNPDRIEILRNEKCRNILHRFVKRIMKNKTEKTAKILGYSGEEFIKSIEAKWQEGMNWSNYGHYGENIWNIDHIKPINLFLKEGITDPATINSLDNLMPMWSSENFKKHTKYERLQ